MAISSVSSNISSQANHIQQNSRPTVSNEVRAEKELGRVRDAGDLSKIKMEASTVNTSGQIIGTTINVTA